MNWEVEYADTALKQLRKLDKRTAKRIIDHMDERIARSANPRYLGKVIVGDSAGPDRLWRYRIGDYRVICAIQDESLTILAVRIGHRREVYRKHAPIPSPLYQ